MQSVVRQNTEVIPRSASDITRQWLASILSELAQEAFSFRVTDGAEPGCNYATAVYAVLVECDSDRQRSISLIIKLPHHDLFGRLFCRLSSCYRREIFVYQQVLSVLATASGSLPVPVLHHAATDDRDNVVMVMNDLRVDGYVMPARHQLLSLNQVQLVVEALARVTAALIVTLQGPHAPQLTAVLQHPIMDVSSVWINEQVNVDLIAMGVQAYMHFLRNYQGKDEMIERLASCVENARQIMIEGMQGVKTCSLRSVCHGDLWKLNLMYHHTAEHEESDRVMLIDWQHCHFGNPLVDIFSLLANNTDTQFRRTNTDSLLKYYHTQISDRVRTAGLDAEKLVPSLKTMKQEYYANMKSAMIRVIFDIVLPLIPEGTMSTMDDSTSDQELVEILSESMRTPTKDRQLEKQLLEFADEMHYHGVL